MELGSDMRLRSLQRFALMSIGRTMHLLKVVESCCVEALGLERTSVRLMRFRVHAYVNPLLEELKCDHLNRRPCFAVTTLKATHFSNAIRILYESTLKLGLKRNLLIMRLPFSIFQK